MCTVAVSSDIVSPKELVETLQYEAKARPDDQVYKFTRDIKDFSRFQDKSKLPQKNFTWTEVSQYNGEDDRQLYIVVLCTVYDITDFGDFHPGGPQVLKDHAGQDATSAMLNCNISSSDTQYFRRFQVGYIVDSNSENGNCQPKSSGEG
ncbi:uncharacterized protein LOC131855164 [Achroia grisella]|uniref:uncharacterized protein LOC131855164 n=1 Tax=Achroia grisella TaxID=688607 RepID=UPI0027D21DE5|nr:uncharacterized protein LOC131855164 [Achroia grisella]